MFDVGWVEMVVVIVVMIIVIGPKDLPVVLHTMGKWIAHVRAMARSFQDSIEEMAEEAGLDEMRDDVRSIRDFSLEDEVEKSIDPEGELKKQISGDSAKAVEHHDGGAGAEAGETEEQGEAEDRGGADKKSAADAKRKRGVPSSGDKA